MDKNSWGGEMYVWKLLGQSTVVSFMYNKAVDGNKTDFAAGVILFALVLFMGSVFGSALGVLVSGSLSDRFKRQMPKVCGWLLRMLFLGGIVLSGLYIMIMIAYYGYGLISHLISTLP